MQTSEGLQVKASNTITDRFSVSHYRTSDRTPAQSVQTKLPCQGLEQSCFGGLTMQQRTELI